jgi:hypothetical protein
MADEKSNIIKLGDLDPDASNPVNIKPQFTGDYSPPKVTISKIPDISPPAEVTTELSGITRPPKPSGVTLGPF